MLKGCNFLKLHYSKKKKINNHTMSSISTTSEVRTTVVSVRYLLSRTLQKHRSWTNYLASTYYILAQLIATRCLNKMFSCHYFSTPTRCLNKLFSCHYLLPQLSATQFQNELFSLCLLYIILCHNNKFPEQTVQLPLHFSTWYSNTAPEQIARLLLTAFYHMRHKNSSWTICSVYAYCILSYVTTTNFLNKLFSIHYILVHDTATQLLNKLLGFY